VTFAVDVVRTRAEFAACVAIRRIVFIVEQHVPEHEEIDGKDDDAVHFLATGADAGAVGTARMLVMAQTAKAQRVAVLSSWRGQRVGEALMRALEAEAAKRGCTEVKLSSQVHALPFYERLGYVAHGDVYMDAGIPHRDMTRAIPATFFR
jgi:predicted GNAT family N-acyltransferase